jgi:hypothetical protein
MKTLIGLALVVAVAAPAAVPNGLAPWCEGKYEPGKGTNFASCVIVDRSQEVQGGDSGGAAADGGSGSSTSN